MFPALEVLFRSLPRLGFMVSFFWNFFEFHELCSRIFRVALLFDCQGTSKADRCAIILESLLSQNVLCNEMLCDSTQRAVFSASCPCFCVASFCCSCLTQLWYNIMCVLHCQHFFKTFFNFFLLVDHPWSVDFYNSISLSSLSITKIKNSLLPFYKVKGLSQNG